MSAKVKYDHRTCVQLFPFHLSRSGEIQSPLLAKQDWVKNVTWLKGDVLDREWKSNLTSDMVAVVSVVGAFGSNDFMEKVAPFDIIYRG